MGYYDDIVTLIILIISFCSSPRKTTKNNSWAVFNLALYKLAAVCGEGEEFEARPFFFFQPIPAVLFIYMTFAIVCVCLSACVRAFEFEHEDGFKRFKGRERELVQSPTLGLLFHLASGNSLHHSSIIFLSFHTFVFL